jgi:hypothetical protein
VTPFRRWLLVALGIVALGSLPAAVSALPAASSDVTAGALRATILTSGDVPFSGYAESTGGLSLPVTTQFTSVANLLGGLTQLRVWWRGDSDWRVDQLSASGEVDVHASAGQLTTWNYEANLLTVERLSANDGVRLPVPADVLPPTLARRLLSQATDAEVSRLPSERIAGVNAVGLRLRPSEGDSTIDRVDIWADPQTGIALRVNGYQAGDEHPALSTSLLDFSRAAPSEQTVSPSIVSGARVALQSGDAINSLLRQFGLPSPPKTLAGVARNELLSTFGAVGVYGRGVTEFVAAPLSGRTGRPLLAELLKTPGMVRTGDDYQVGIGPLNLLLSNPGGGRTFWLLVGTVKPSLLAQASAQLPKGPPA